MSRNLSSRFVDCKPERSSVEVGYTFLTRKYWGGPCNLELKRLMLDYAFQFVDSVYFLVGAENRRSRGALLKIGAIELENVSTGAVKVDAKCIVYRVAKVDWRTNH